MEKKYFGLTSLSCFTEKLRENFAFKDHSHIWSDILDATIDESLSITSANPVQNKAVTQEIDSIKSTISDIEILLESI